MKLLLENWRRFINEDWRDTSWETDNEKVTIGDVIDYLGDETVDINVSELSQQLPHSLPTHGEERIAAANLDYPIIVVKSGGQYQSVLDGNHRLQKAIDAGAESIKAKILDLDSPETPEEYKRIFGDKEDDEDELTPNQKEFPERYGNCGMLALALIEEGIKREIQGIEIVFVTATDEDEFLEVDEPEIHHVAMWLNGKYYDDRGEISEDQLGDFSPLGLTSPEDAKPKEGRDYLVLFYKMEDSEELAMATDIVKNNTNWWKSCEEYIQRAEDFWDNI